MKPLPVKNRMNQIETAFAWMLQAQKIKGEIIDFRFEPITFNLAPKTTYTPDFEIVWSDHFEYVDIKAKGGETEKISKVTGKPYKKRWSSMRDDAAVKIKVAAAQNPWVKWSVWYALGNGDWVREEIGAKDGNE